VKKGRDGVRGTAGKTKCQRASKMELWLKEAAKPPDVADCGWRSRCARCGGRAWRGGEGGDEDRGRLRPWLTPEALGGWEGGMGSPHSGQMLVSEVAEVVRAVPAEVGGVAGVEVNESAAEDDRIDERDRPGR